MIYRVGSMTLVVSGNSIQRSPATRAVLLGNHSCEDYCGLLATVIVLQLSSIVLTVYSDCWGQYRLARGKCQLIAR